MDYGLLTNLTSEEEANNAVTMLLDQAQQTHPEILGPRMMLALSMALRAIAFSNVGKPPVTCLGEKQVRMLLTSPDWRSVESILTAHLPPRHPGIRKYFSELYAQPGYKEEVVAPALKVLMNPSRTLRPFDVVMRETHEKSVAKQKAYARWVRSYNRWLAWNSFSCKMYRFFHPVSMRNWDDKFRYRIWQLANRLGFHINIWPVPRRSLASGSKNKWLTSR